MGRTLLASLLLLGAAGHRPAVPSGPVVVGICPFEDETGTQMGEWVGRLLPVLFLNQAKTSNFSVVLVNPGSMADVTDLQWPAEVARQVGADVLVMGRVRVIGESKGTSAALPRGAILNMSSGRLTVEAQLVDAATARAIRPLNASETVRGVWFSTVPVGFHMVTLDPPKFADSSLGKAVVKVAASLRDQVAGTPDLPARGALKPGSGGPCSVRIQVRYSEKDRASKVYSIAVNGREETLQVKDGVLTKELPSGPLFLHITPTDVPFRQMVQMAYYTNPVVDCSSSQHNLSFEIGNSGEGIPRWK